MFHAKDSIIYKIATVVLFLFALAVNVQTFKLALSDPSDGFFDKEKGAHFCSALNALSYEDLRAQQLKKTTLESEVIKVFTAPNSKGTVLIAHGLNLRPSAMNELALELRDRGFSVVRMSLQGHLGDRELFSQVRLSDWQEEFGRAYCVAQALSCDGDVSFLGFSLGALLGVNFEQQNPNAFDAKVLFAPALVSRYFTKWLGLLSWFPKLPIPSISTKEFRANDATPIAAYNALFESQQALESSKISPTTKALVWIDPRDEVIDILDLQTWLKKRDISWDLRPIQTKTKSGLKHHLVIAKNNFEPNDWLDMVSSSENWFLKHKRVKSEDVGCTVGR